MTTSQERRDPSPFKDLSQKDKDLVRLHIAFDEITNILENKCFHSNEIQHSIDLIGGSRHFVMLSFIKSYAEVFEKC